MVTSSSPSGLVQMMCLLICVLVKVLWMAERKYVCWSFVHPLTSCGSDISTVSTMLKNVEFIVRFRTLICLIDDIVVIPYGPVLYVRVGETVEKKNS